MSNEFKGTKGPWVADIRGGCAAIYPVCRNDDTPGCHADDDRNIVFSSKGAKYNGMRWELDGSVEHDFNLMAAAPDLLEALQDVISKINAISGASDVWWIDSPDRGGFDMDKLESTINKALGVN